MSTAPKLRGKVVIAGKLETLTGLRIGAAGSALEIGGIDNPVVRDPITEKPYVPGSGLKGKLRSLVTKAYGLPLRRLVRQPPEIWLHWCESRDEYMKCVVCPTFGQFPSGPGQERFPFVTPTRLIVRDAHLLDELVVRGQEGNEERRRWSDVETDLPYTEVKVEVALDVVTAASNPRQMERVPPGALFDCELLFSVFGDDGELGIGAGEEKERLKTVLLAMRLLEDDYLGSSGTRGYGKVRFREISVRWRPLEYYSDPSREEVLWQGDRLDDALAQFEEKIGARVWPLQEQQQSLPS
jgi:CRISPR-associated protein Csm3